MKELLRHPNIDVNKQDKDGWTALAVAYYNKRKEIVKLIEEKNPEINSKNIKTKLQHLLPFEEAQWKDPNEEKFDFKLYIEFIPTLAKRPENRIEHWIQKYGNSNEPCYSSSQNYELEKSFERVQQKYKMILSNSDFIKAINLHTEKSNTEIMKVDVMKQIIPKDFDAVFQLGAQVLHVALFNPLLFNCCGLAPS